ncbi:hypothetical protein 10S8_2 [uncultured Caudovirales phage]|uniref:Uncharacterized protein n=1 Tax=uncultured Caudovirales phage TaxID=2100421 RepID=A0A2H4JFS1_9CAUD|nr:hypothetical protein 10S8_2 [uncultured Caudovirales phage]
MMKKMVKEQLKSLVALNAAIAEAGEEIQTIQKEINTYGYDEKYSSALNDLKQKTIYYRYQKVKNCVNLYDKIEALEDEQEKRLLKYRYLRGWRWEDIADKMGYSVRQVFNIHIKSINNLESPEN